MKQRKIKIAVNFSGMTMPVGEVKIHHIAKKREIGEYTDLVCPACSQKPVRISEKYACSCGQNFNHWTQLKRVYAGTNEKVEMPRLIQPKQDVLASIWMLPKDEFMNYVDATIAEYGCITQDSTTAKNLKKLLIASEKLGYVIILTFNDTYEERIALLTTSLSNRVILKEIIPINLAEIEETMRVSFEGLTEAEIQEAEAFVKLLPKATRENLLCHDYRAKAIPATAKPESIKVQDLEAILATIPAK